MFFVQQDDWSKDIPYTSNKAVCQYGDGTHALLSWNFFEMMRIVDMCRKTVIMFYLCAFPPFFHRKCLCLPVFQDPVGLYSILFDFYQLSGNIFRHFSWKLLVSCGPVSSQKTPPQVGFKALYMKHTGSVFFHTVAVFFFSYLILICILNMLQMLLCHISQLTFHSR